jgi:cupin fold WbuC family metalloprotein
MSESSELAFENPSGDRFRLTSELIINGIKASRNSERLRIILPVHRAQSAIVQRLINFLQPGTYIRPHKHPLDHASESIVLLQGEIRFFTFDNKGNVNSSEILSSSPIPGVVDIEPGVWHSFLVLEKDTILFECKKGPYNTKTDKEFAKWAPEESDPESKKWMKKLAE